jgi:hypothetical protein
MNARREHGERVRDWNGDSQIPGRSIDIREKVYIAEDGIKVSGRREDGMREPV